MAQSSLGYARYDGLIALSNDFEKALLRARPALERNWNLRPPTGTKLDVRPPTAVLRVEMQEGDTLEVENAAGTLRNAWKLSELAKYILKVEQIFLASVSHVGEVEGRPRSARSSAADVQSLQRRGAHTQAVHGPLKRLLGVATGATVDPKFTVAASCTNVLD